MNNYCIKNLETKSIVGLIVALIALLNSVLLMMGINPVNISEELIYQAMSAVVSIVSTIYVAYKNNNLSDASVQGQEVTDAIKAQQYVINENDGEEE